ncbi:hypothetical protein R6Q57_005716 [Mikania cordata]
MKNRGGKYKFERLHPLKKFGQFEEMEGVDAVEATEIPNVFVEKEHDVEIVSSKPSDEDVYVVKFQDYEDVVTRDEPDLDFDFETETIPVESDLPEHVNRLTIENLEALLEHVKRTTITVEPTEPIAQIKESAAGSSSHTEDIDYDSFLAAERGVRVDKGKNVLPNDEPIDIVKLQSITNNVLKDKKTKDPETNMGHLSAIVLDLKQNLQDKFKGEFIDESSPSNASESLTRSREEGLWKFFAGDTGFKVSIAKSRELMMITDRTIQEAKDAAKYKHTSFIVDLGDSR